MSKIYLKRQAPVFKIIITLAGIAFLIIGVFQLLPVLKESFNPAFPGGDWNPIIFLIEGLLFLGIGMYLHFRKKHFIRLGKEKLQLQIPQQDSIQSIPWNEINHVHIGLTEVDIVTKSGEEKNIPLHAVADYQKMKKVKKYFEELQQEIKTREEMET